MSFALPRPLNILLADDDEDDRIFFRDALQQVSPDATLSVVENGVELMRRLGRNSLPDLLFLDLNMPLKNGYECLFEIHSNPRLQRLPVIILSTSSVAEHINDMLKDLACLYIKKPGTFDELKAHLQHALSLDFTKEKCLEEKR
jgi:CheY-like chemotaxis protein